jgi:hypothetical protein
MVEHSFSSDGKGKKQSSVAISAYPQPLALRGFHCFRRAIIICTALLAISWQSSSLVSLSDAASQPILRAVIRLTFALVSFVTLFWAKILSAPWRYSVNLCSPGFRPPPLCFDPLFIPRLLIKKDFKQQGWISPEIGGLVM